MSYPMKLLNVVVALSVLISTVCALDITDKFVEKNFSVDPPVNQCRSFVPLRSCCMASSRQISNL